MKRLSTAAAVPRSAALLTVALERPARCCDRAREPWIAFDGDLSAVSAAAAGAPVAWRLNGDAAVRRSYSGCNEQTLTIDTRAAVGPGSACARTSSNDGPDAVVHFRRLATSLGQAGAGGAADSRPRWRTVAPPLSLRGSGAAHTLRVVYALARAQAARSTRECVESCADTYVPALRLFIILVRGKTRFLQSLTLWSTTIPSNKTTREAAQTHSPSWSLSCAGSLRACYELTPVPHGSPSVTPRARPSRAPLVGRPPPTGRR